MQNVKTKLAVVGASLVSGSAMATGATAAETAFTSIGTEVSNMIGYAWPVVTAVAVGLIGIKLFKKFVSRAS